MYLDRSKIHGSHRIIYEYSIIEHKPFVRKHKVIYCTKCYGEFHPKYGMDTLLKAECLRDMKQKDYSWIDIIEDEE